MKILLPLIACVVWLPPARPAVAADGGAGPDLTISLSAETNSVCRGEPLTILVSVLNTSTKPVVVPVNWASGRFTMRHALGGVPPREWNPFAEPDGMDRAVTLQLGEAHRVVTDLLFVSGGGEPGQHTLKARLESDGWYRSLDGDSGRMVKGPCWAGTIESEPLSLTIKALDTPEDRDAWAVLTHGKDLSSVWLYTDAVLAGTDKRYVTVLEKYPKSVFAKHCDMALARTYARRFGEAGGHFDEAVRHYTNVIDNYPAFSFTDDAMLELARVYLRKERIDPGKGYRGKAVERLKDLIKMYPKADSVPAAERLLAETEKQR